MWPFERDPAALLALRDDVVYWIVPALCRVRHGITDKPGRWPAGTAVTALCGLAVKIPCPTPLNSEPRTRGITEQCPECAAEYERKGFHSTVWDF
ncbi:hypothetical protein HUO13_03445 [Saccharopolyspora erythraea]|uniref:hypothetical protein n=1 Tax=Saccharopolyspora erythraea TaxID=1836 RepID=UPI001BAB0F05|nr:hypothetical protein [Saccharopolyspora erythraea]QUG99987.1 hypothetical protein HUO13_03445 [Saccharopolyspora erythraea]